MKKYICRDCSAVRLHVSEMMLLLEMARHLNAIHGVNLESQILNYTRSCVKNYAEESKDKDKE